jgi:transcriptional regulator with XRE-family HTH domain
MRTAFVRRRTIKEGYSLMDKIRVSALLEQYGLTWYGLYKRGQGSISKSMAHDWQRGAHLPSRKSVVKIAFALGLPAAYLLDLLQTREKHQNFPLQAAFCISCHHKLYRIPENSDLYESLSERRAL